MVRTAAERARIPENVLCSAAICGNKCRIAPVWRFLQSSVDSFTAFETGVYPAIIIGKDESVNSLSSFSFLEKELVISANDFGTKKSPLRILGIERQEVWRMKKRFMDCNCWAWCCSGFGFGIVLAVFASLKLALILTGALLIALGIRILLL